MKKFELSAVKGRAVHCRQSILVPLKSMAITAKIGFSIYEALGSVSCHDHYRVLLTQWKGQRSVLRATQHATLVIITPHILPGHQAITPLRYPAHLATANHHAAKFVLGSSHLAVMFICTAHATSVSSNTSELVTCPDFNISRFSLSILPQPINY